MGSGAAGYSNADKLNFSRAALQISYGISDQYIYYDSAAKEAQEEGETFETRSKVLEATITGFTARGDYTVEFTGQDDDLEQRHRFRRFSQQSSLVQRAL